MCITFFLVHISFFNATPYGKNEQEIDTIIRAKLEKTG